MHISHKSCDIFRREYHEVRDHHQDGALQGLRHLRGVLPKSVLAVSELGKIQVVNGDACIGCGQCELRCPDYAIFVDRVKEEAAQ